MILSKPETDYQVHTHKVRFIPSYTIIFIGNVQAVKIPYSAMKNMTLEEFARLLKNKSVQDVISMLRYEKVEHVLCQATRISRN